MVRRIVKLIWIIAFVAGCSEPDRKGRATTFVTEAEEAQELEEIPPLLRQDERETEMPTYEIPQNLRDRVKQELPEFIPTTSDKFKLIKQNLKINVKNSTMTFSGVLQIPGQPDEAIELQCKFDKTKDWLCGDMFPTNPEIARQRRLQATVNCLDIYRCDKVGLEFFVRINGSTESQLFQSSRFEIRQATSGDVDEDQVFRPVTKKPPRPPRVLEKPTKRPSPMRRPPAITDEAEVNRLLDDPNAAAEITAPLPVPPPTRGEYSIPDIEKLRPEIGSGVLNQAIGAHHDGRLAQPAKLPRQGSGFIARPGREEKSYGTNLMIDLLTSVSAQVQQTAPSPSPFLISNISKATGGKLCNPRGNGKKSCHKSHQTGLDVDVAFPFKSGTPDLKSVCDSSGSKCKKPITENFDAQRFWLFAKQATCAEKNPVIIIFVDTAIKKHICGWARQQGEDVDNPNSCAHRTLRAMKYSPGHHNHFHMRLKCPGNRDCRNATVSLARGTGC